MSVPDNFSRQADTHVLRVFVIVDTSIWIHTHTHTQRRIVCNFSVCECVCGGNEKPDRTHMCIPPFYFIVSFRRKTARHEEGAFCRGDKMKSCDKERTTPRLARWNRNEDIQDVCLIHKTVKTILPTYNKMCIWKKVILHKISIYIFYLTV